MPLYYSFTILDCLLLLTMQLNCMLKTRYNNAAVKQCDQCLFRIIASDMANCVLFNYTGSFVESVIKEHIAHLYNNMSRNHSDLFKLTSANWSLQLQLWRDDCIHEYVFTIIDCLLLLTVQLNWDKLICLQNVVLVLLLCCVWADRHWDWKNNKNSMKSMKNQGENH